MTNDYSVKWDYIPPLDSIGNKTGVWWINYPQLPINNPPPAFDIFDYLKHIQQLERENIELHKTVKDLQQRMSRKRKR